MKVYVVFDFPDINDPNSEDADNIIDCLENDLTELGEETGHVWYIDDAVVGD